MTLIKKALVCMLLGGACLHLGSANATPVLGFGIGAFDFLHLGI